MSGYAAPAIPVVRVGVIGLGDRGSGAVKRLSFIEGVEIKALCDIRKVALKVLRITLKVLEDLKHVNFPVMIMHGRNWLSCRILILFIYVLHGSGILRWLFMQWKTESMLPVRYRLPVQLMKHGSLLRHRRRQKNIA